MSEFESDAALAAEVEAAPAATAAAAKPAKSVLSNAVVPVNFDAPVRVHYCKVCGMPIEYCEYGSQAEACLNYLIDNEPELLSDEQLERSLNDMSLDDPDKKKKAPVAAAPSAGGKKKAASEPRILISKQQMQKKRFSTVVEGLETFPGKCIVRLMANSIYFNTCSYLFSQKSR